MVNPGKRMHILQAVRFLPLFIFRILQVAVVVDAVNCIANKIFYL